MNVRHLVSLAVVIALGSAGAAQAQSLTELAKAEKARRAKMRGTPSKVYTESGSSATASADASATGSATAAAPGAPADPNAPKQKSRQEQDAEAQKAWSEKVKKVQDEITSLEGVISKNEVQLASTFNITPARAQLASQIEADKKKVADLKQQLVALEDERRRAGIARPRS